GKLNGVGGRIKKDEMPANAMVRKFKEETGMDTTIGQWTPFLFQQGSHFSNEIFYTKGDLDLLENVEIIDLCSAKLFEPDFLHDINWMITLALNSMNHSGPNYISVSYS